MKRFTGKFLTYVLILSLAGSLAGGSFVYADEPVPVEDPAPDNEEEEEPAEPADPDPEEEEEEKEEEKPAETAPTPEEEEEKEEKEEEEPAEEPAEPDKAEEEPDDFQFVPGVIPIEHEYEVPIVGAPNAGGEKRRARVSLPSKYRAYEDKTKLPEGLPI